jgi:hypothetical protein
MADPKFDRHWQAPPRDADASVKMAWCSDIASAAEQAMQTRAGFKDIPRAIDLVSGLTNSKVSESRSKLTTNRGKRVLREIIANISDIRPVDGYSSENPAYAANAEMFNKLWKCIHFESHFPSTMKKAVQWLAAGGTSYISPVYRNTRLTAKSKRRLVFDALSTVDALPFQMPEDNNVQGAYAWTLFKFMPEFEAHAKFPKFQAQLRPVAKRRYSGNAAKDRLTLAERFKFGDSPVQGQWAEQYDEIRYTYVRDLSINETKKPVPIGAPGALESYVVPFVGMELPTGEFNLGKRIMRKAVEEDCYLYPNLRLFITQRGMRQPMYDGPSFYWHGMFPLARFSADEWPWEAGYSLVRDICSIEDTRQSFERGLDQTAKARFDPALIYDKNAMPRKTAEQFDPYEERGRLGLDGEANDATVRTALPESMLAPPGGWMEWLKYLSDTEDDLLGLSALNNLAKAKMAAGDDALEKAQEEAGPIAKDISHSMEAPIQDLMEMTLYNVLQFYPTGRLMNYLGPDGVTINVFDLKPSELTPSHIQGEDPEAGESAFTRMERTQIFLENINFSIAPGTLHGIVQTEQKLLFMQLQRAGFIISSETVAKAVGVPDWGELPGNTELDKWRNEQEMKLIFAARMQAIGADLAPQAGPGGPSGPAAPPPPNLGGGAKPGRPPSGQKPPELVTKASAAGPRAVVKES